VARARITLLSKKIKRKKVTKRLDGGRDGVVENILKRKKKRNIKIEKRSQHHLIRKGRNQKNLRN